MKDEKIKEIINILRKVDAFNLIAEGAPTDEYDHEAPELYLILSGKHENTVTKDKIIKYYEEHFNPFLIKISKIEYLVDELIKLMC